MVGNLVGDRAEQEALGAGHALVAHDDQIGVTFLGQAVAYPSNSVQVYRSARIGLDLLANHADVDVQGAFVAINAKPVPTFAVVSMCYLIGGLAGSIPLPANLGAVGGMTGMLVVFGIDKNQAVAAVVLYQAIGFLVPLIGGAIAYLFVRREFGSMQEEADDEPSGGAGGGAPQPAG